MMLQQTDFHYPFIMYCFDCDILCIGLNSDLSYNLIMVIYRENSTQSLPLCVVLKLLVRVLSLSQALNSMQVYLFTLSTKACNVSCTTIGAKITITGKIEIAICNNFYFLLFIVFETTVMLNCIVYIMHNASVR